MVAINYLFGLVALVASASASKLSFFPSLDCTGGGGSITDTTQNGACSQLNPNDAHSFRTEEVDTGCSVTVYSDSNCSSGSTAGLGQCLTFESGLGSYSIDC